MEGFWRKFGPSWWLRAFGLAVLDGIALLVIIDLFDQGATIAWLSVLIGTLGINYIFISSRTYPLRWLVPGMVFLTLLVLWPIVFTVIIGFTNWSNGNFITKPQALERITEGTRYLVQDESQVVETYYYRDPAEVDPLDQIAGLRMLVVTEDGTAYFGTPRLSSDLPPEEPDTIELTAVEAPIVGEGIPPDQIGPYQLLLLRDIQSVSNVIDDLILDIPGQGQVQSRTFSSGILAVQRFGYDEANGVLIDREFGGVCPEEEGTFYCQDGNERIDPGWRVFIGFENYSAFLTDERVRGPFLKIFVWNVIFAASVVFIQLFIGMGLAITFNDARMKGRRTMRSLLIIPYAAPAFIVVIVWRGLLNPSFGLVNRFLAFINPFVDEVTIPWVQPSGDWFWSKIAVILVTVWIGFPYFFLITTGALQSIPHELQEAARVDGASGGQVFRRITFPLLMVGIAPLIIASFAFNFNAFVNIFLLTAGGPPVSGAGVPYGETDILITFVFDLAVEGGRGGQFALAAAATFFIFLIVALIAAFAFRFTKRLENIYGNL